MFLVECVVVVLEAAKLSLAESKRLNGQMKTQLLRHPEAQAKWQEICSLPNRGCQKNLKKRLFMFTWKECEAKDETSFGPTFWSEVKQLVSQDMGAERRGGKGVAGSV